MGYYIITNEKNQVISYMKNAEKPEELKENCYFFEDVPEEFEQHCYQFKVNNGQLQQDKRLKPPMYQTNKNRQQAAELMQWFAEYDKEVIQLQREIRLGLKNEEALKALDKQADENAKKLKALKKKLNK